MKIKFLNQLKHGLFLCIAVLGTFVGYSQVTPYPSIGGNKIPGAGGGIPYVVIASSTAFALLKMENTSLAPICCKANPIGGGSPGGKGTGSDTGQLAPWGVTSSMRGGFGAALLPGIFNGGGCIGSGTNVSSLLYRHLMKTLPILATDAFGSLFLYS